MEQHQLAEEIAQEIGVFYCDLCAAHFPDCDELTHKHCMICRDRKTVFECKWQCFVVLGQTNCPSSMCSECVAELPEGHEFNDSCGTRFIKRGNDIEAIRIPSPVMNAPNRPVIQAEAEAEPEPEDNSPESADDEEDSQTDTDLQMRLDTEDDDVRSFMRPQVIRADIRDLDRKIESKLNTTLRIRPLFGQQQLQERKRRIVVDIFGGREPSPQKAYSLRRKERSLPEKISTSKKFTAELEEEYEYLKYVVPALDFLDSIKRELARCQQYEEYGQAA
jgi:hypothetical protein